MSAVHVHMYVGKYFEAYGETRAADCRSRLGYLFDKKDTRGGEERKRLRNSRKCTLWKTRYVQCGCWGKGWWCHGERDEQGQTTAHFLPYLYIQLTYSFLVVFFFCMTPQRCREPTSVHHLLSGEKQKENTRLFRVFLGMMLATGTRVNVESHASKETTFMTIEGHSLFSSLDS